MNENNTKDLINHLFNKYAMNEYDRYPDEMSRYVIKGMLKLLISEIERLEKKIKLLENK